MDREVWWATVCGVAKELRFFGIRHDLATQQQQQSSAFNVPTAAKLLLVVKLHYA